MAVIYKRREISVELQTLFDGLTPSSSRHMIEWRGPLARTPERASSAAAFLSLTLCAFFGILKTKGALMGFGNGTI